ncbi:MAG: TfoX/Sxy family protein [Bacteroidia bacterium]|nr:TfoX/Sxy family protein [Bacteroidia bacterium]
MAYDLQLADRIRQNLKERAVIFSEKLMFGGICFMVDGKMCLGVVKEDLMARIGEETYPEAIKMKGARDMDFTKRPMKGYAFVSPEGVDMDSDLEAWIQMCLDFNPKAKASKKKKADKA